MSSRQYSPDRWKLLKFVKEDAIWFRVLGGWSGGYLDGDSWRLSSHVEEVKDAGDHYIVKNMSGSTYKCSKTGEGFNMISASTYAEILETAPKLDMVVTEVDVKDYLEDSP